MITNKRGELITNIKPKSNKYNHKQKKCQNDKKYYKNK